MDLMSRITKHVSQTKFEDIPSEAVAVAKKSVIDTIGVVIAGSSVEGCRLFMDYARNCRGKPQATVAVFGEKLSGPYRRPGERRHGEGARNR